MNDWELLAKVFDGGVGWHPLLPEAQKAYRRQWDAEMARRNPPYDLRDAERQRVDDFIDERIHGNLG